jgi:uncharacterized protein YndB with AHSA1/START domain
MRILIPILVAVVGLAVVLAGVVATRPAEFVIQRSATFAARPETVFALVNDFHRWDGWSPYAKLDPDMKVTYDGAPAGVGARYSWSGDDRIGEGRMTIVESKPAERVAIDLEFSRPMAARNLATFTFVPDGAGTRVTWAMQGRNGFVGKAFAMLMNMDRMVGGQFEEGLASMKALAEASP